MTKVTDIAGARLRPLSEHLFAFADTCNVYLVTDGDAGLVIDAGSGAVADHVADAGVGTLEWVLHTHHHRDQCWGAPRLVAEHGTRVAVPEHERYLFASAREHWRTKRIFDNYNDRNTFFAPAADIPVDAILEDYEEFHWRGYRFFVLPAKGHTSGSSALLAELDGRLVAFTGDLIASGGYLYQLHAMEYGYGDLLGVLFTIESLQALRRHDPALILPSHGAPVRDVAGDVDRLQKRLIDIVRLGFCALDSWSATPAADSLPGPSLLRLSEHLLWGGPWTCSNFYVLLSGTGEALLIDYGHSFGAHLHIGTDQLAFESFRFVAHHLDELSERFGVTSIDAVIPTHIHDDHACGIPYLQRHHGTACWALDRVAEVLEAPAAWASTPCLYAKPIRVRCRLADGDRVAWRGFELTFHHAPGQTEFHSVISARIDGKTVAFTGDNYFLHDVVVGGQHEQRPKQTMIFRNSFQLAMHRRCVEVMRAIEPELICPGHDGVLSCDQRALDHYADFVALKEQSFRAAVAAPVDHHIDLFWARVRPYLATVAPGARLEYTLMLRNNLERTATYAARMLAPADGSGPGELRTVTLAPDAHGELNLTVRAPASPTGGRVVLTTEILIDGRSQGPVAEALVSVEPGPAA
jgi:glyoxylase-like metal-dependent hydrolase (beta-lactamase superfamily II)